MGRCRYWFHLFLFHAATNPLYYTQYHNEDNFQINSVPRLETLTALQTMVTIFENNGLCAASLQETTCIVKPKSTVCTFERPDNRRKTSGAMLQLKMGYARLSATGSLTKTSIFDIARRFDVPLMYSTII